MTAVLADRHVPGLLAAFGLGPRGRLSSGPVARGRLGGIWRLDADDASWAVKVDDDIASEDLPELLEGAAFQEAAFVSGVPVPAVRRTVSGDLIGDLGDVRVRVLQWVDLEEPDLGLDPADVGRLVAALHRVPFVGAIGTDPWYTEPVAADRWAEVVAALLAGRAPFADELAALVPELAALADLVSAPPRALRTCHRDLWADNVRRTMAGRLCAFDFDNAGLADPSGELAAVLVEYAGADRRRAAALRQAYADAGGPGRVETPADFLMPVAQLGHIVEEGCRRWLAATSDDERADNEGWVREFIDRPLTERLIEQLLRT